MTAPQKAALAVMNQASAKLAADQILLDVAEADFARAQAIRMGIQTGGLAAAWQTESDLGLKVVELRRVVQIDDTVAEFNAEQAFEAAMRNPGAVVG